jgi:hypothetical protein
VNWVEGRFCKKVLEFPQVQPTGSRREAWKRKHMRDYAQFSSKILGWDQAQEEEGTSEALSQTAGW